MKKEQMDHRTQIDCFSPKKKEEDESVVECLGPQYDSQTQKEQEIQGL